MAKKKEPSLRDVLGGMNSRFNMVFSELQKIDGRFETVHRYLSNLREEILEIKEGQKADSEVLDEIRDEVSSISKAVDKDAVTVVVHETRIAKLEKALRAR